MAVFATSDFYVYLHLRESDGNPFYVGKGCGRRAYLFSGRNQYWNRVKDKHGCTVKILFNNLTEDLAFELEKEIISTLRKDGYSLCNLTDGGEGSSGIIVSSETRKKISAIHKGVPKKPEAIAKTRSAHLGKVVSEDVRLNMSLAQIGKKHTKETKIKMSETHFLHPPYQDKNIYTFYHKSGEVFTGTRIELCRKYGLNPNQIKNLFATKPSKTNKGWSLTQFSVEE